MMTDTSLAYSAVACAPVHQNSLLLFREHVAQRIPKDGRILEIGADGDPSTFARECGCPAGWETADLASEAGEWSGDGSRARVLMPSEYEIPIESDHFDVVLSGQVAEHVREIWTWMRELARVTKPGGRVITISPVSWPYHEAPVDCWRMYPAAMEALSEFAGLTVEFSWWASLEPKLSRRTYPGLGSDQIAGNVRGLAWRIRRLVGWPIPVAYDLVTVAWKGKLS
jgi:SAM-dependent methyltransferase